MEKFSFPLIAPENANSVLIWLAKPATRWVPQMVLFASRIVDSWQLGGTSG